MEDKYSLDGVREDAERLLSGKEKRGDVILTAKAYYEGSAVEIEGSKSEVIDTFLVAWQSKK